MELCINKIQHQYITRVIIFAIFLYKGRIRQPNVYKQLVHIFVIKKLGKKTNLEINTGDYISTEDARDLILDELLNDKVSDYLKTVKIKFITPLKDMHMSIDIYDEDKYKKFLYS